MKPYSLMSESELQEAVAEYLVRQYPDVMFHSDFGSGAKMTKNQAARQRRQNGYRKGWPDMFIAEPMVGHIRMKKLSLVSHYETEAQDVCSGLFLELKKEGTRLFAVSCKPHDPRRGLDTEVYANVHIKEQADCLYELRQRGYCAEFAVGFEEAKRIIDEYLGGK